MSQELQPHKVTKPIQLLAAWLLGLVAVDGAFLTAARLIVEPHWAPGILVIAAVVSVPLFLFCIFLLQTKFRPEMQEDSYYSQYLAVRQQTLKVGSSKDQIVQLRELLVSSQVALSDGLTAIDIGLAEIREQLPQATRVRSESEAEGVIEVSERVLTEARNRLLPAEVRVEVNDLLPMYKQLLKMWHGSRIKVTETFGSTSSPSTIPVFPVVALDKFASPEAMYEVCKSLIDTGRWYVEVAELPLGEGQIYVGAYGYGGKEVSPLNEELVAEMAQPNFSTSRLEQWISDHPVRLDADYPRGAP